MTSSPRFTFTQENMTMRINRLGTPLAIAGLLVATAAFASKRHILTVQAGLQPDGRYPDLVEGGVRFGAEEGGLGDECSLPGSNGKPRQHQFGLLVTNISSVEKKLTFNSIHGRTDFMGPSGGTSYQSVPVNVVLAPGGQKEISWYDCAVGKLTSLSVEVFIEG